MTFSLHTPYRSEPARLLVAFVLVHLLVWTLVPWLGHWRVPIDNLEQLDWVRHIAWGYAKHPPFPTWLLGLAAQVLPLGIPLTYGLGALCTGLMLWLTWRLSDELLDRRRACIAVLLVCGITYYTSHVRYYNHNTLLMVAHAAATLAIWRCAQGGQTLWWWLLGVAWGLGMLSKYQMALTLCCNIGFLAVLARDPQRRGEVRHWVKGLLLAAAVCAAILVPHLLWLVDNQFPTFAYAGKSVAANQVWLHRPLDILQFVGHHLGRTLAMLAMTLLLLWLGRGRLARQSVPPRRNDDFGREARWLLVMHGLAPFALMALLTLLGGVALQIHWGTAYLWLLAPWYLTTLPGRRLTQLPLPWILAGLLVVQAGTLTQYALR